MYDMARFRRNYYGAGNIRLEHRLARITALYHVLEKGLSFSNSRALFGKDKVNSLLLELKACVGNEDAVSAVPWQSAIYVLDSYLNQNKVQLGCDGQDAFLQKLEIDLQLLKKNLIESGVKGGTVDCQRADIQSRAKGDFTEMALSRYSVRHFTEEPVPSEVIEQAVTWSQKSPSVCNRQGSRIYAIRDRMLIDQILTVHGGTRGFTEQINTLLIVTGDLRIFFSPTERNQVYLDSGIFTMSLLYGLHYLGVGACPLHWCVDPDTDRTLRELVKIPDEQIITTLIGVGSLPETFKVAHSQRKPLDDVLIWK
jgi:nitroreductase